MILVFVLFFYLDLFMKSSFTTIVLKWVTQLLSRPTWSTSPLTLRLTYFTYPWNFVPLCLPWRRNHIPWVTYMSYVCYLLYVPLHTACLPWLTCSKWPSCLTYLTYLTWSTSLKCLSDPCALRDLVLYFPYVPYMIFVACVSYVSYAPHVRLQSFSF